MLVHSPALTSITDCNSLVGKAIGGKTEKINIVNMPTVTDSNSNEAMKAEREEGRGRFLELSGECAVPCYCTPPTLKYSVYRADCRRRLVAHGTES